MSKNMVSIKEKVEREHPDFVKEVSALNDDAIDVRLSTLAKGLAETARAKREDEELEEARQTASDLSAPYRDAEKMIKMKIGYLSALLQERGKQ